MSAEPVEVLLKRLNAIARGRESTRGFHFFCQVGDAQWKYGVTTVQLSGTGWTLVGHKEHDSDDDDDDELYSVYISARDMRAFVRTLLQHPFWDLDTTRWKRREGETNIHIRLADTGKRFAWDVQIWSGERESQAHLGELLKMLNVIIQTVSDSQIRPV